MINDQNGTNPPKMTPHGPKNKSAYPQAIGWIGDPFLGQVGGEDKNILNAILMHHFLLPPINTWASSLSLHTQEVEQHSKFKGVSILQYRLERVTRALEECRTCRHPYLLPGGVPDLLASPTCTSMGVTSFQVYTWDTTVMIISSIIISYSLAG